MHGFQWCPYISIVRSWIVLEKTVEPVTQNGTVPGCSWRMPLWMETHATSASNLPRGRRTSSRYTVATSIRWWWWYDGDYDDDDDDIYDDNGDDGKNFLFCCYDCCRQDYRRQLRDRTFVFVFVTIVVGNIKESIERRRAEIFIAAAASSFSAFAFQLKTPSTHNSHFQWKFSFSSLQPLFWFSSAFSLISFSVKSLFSVSRRRAWPSPLVQRQLRFWRKLSERWEKD